MEVDHIHSPRYSRKTNLSKHHMDLTICTGPLQTSVPPPPCLPTCLLLSSSFLLHIFHNLLFACLSLQSPSSSSFTAISMPSSPVFYFLHPLPFSPPPHPSLSRPVLYSSTVSFLSSSSLSFSSSFLISHLSRPPSLPSPLYPLPSSSRPIPCLISFSSANTMTRGGFQLSLIPFPLVSVLKRGHR